MCQTRFAYLLMSFSLLTILMGGCKPAETERPDVKPVYGGCFRDVSIADAITFMPLLVTDTASFKVTSLMYNGLVKYDGDFKKLVPDLAETWVIPRDGRTITFRLRKGVKWHDDAPFTSKDVLFTYQRMVDPKTKSPYSASYKQVKKAEAPDDYTFKVTYSKPFAPALASWTMAILPKHLYKGQDISKLGNDIDKYPKKKPIGTGPYMFKERIPDKKIVLTYNPHYFLGRAHLDEYVFSVIPDQATMFLELKAGNIDRMILTPLQYRRQTKYPRFAKMYKKYCYEPYSYVYLGYNLKKKLFEDRKVRQALTCAINKKEIIEGVLLGLGKEATGPWNPDALYYWEIPQEHEHRFDYNPERARQLLNQADWKLNDQGILEKGGKPFIFTILTSHGHDTRKRTAAIIQRQLREVGIVVKIRTLKWGELVKVFTDGGFEAVLMGWDTGPEPDIQYDIWHSKGKLNSIHYNNPEVDAALEAGRNTFDQEERRNAYLLLQELLAEDQPYTFLFIPYALPAINKRFRGVKFNSLGEDYNFHEWWYVPEHEQLKNDQKGNSSP
jgi:peptide/nickel transport system substrate-binding protein